MYIRDEYTAVFRECIIETQHQTGYELPEDLQAYLAILLGSYIDRPYFLPQDSFAQAYMTLREPRHLSAKELADVCLFVVGVFPNMGKRYGLDASYYSSIGVSSYDIAAQGLNKQLFELLRDQFDLASEIIKLSTSPKPVQLKIG
jgi:hypothetical protein